MNIKTAGYNGACTVFGIFDKHPRGCNEFKNSMGLLQGPRLMAWITKSPIWGNHWVPLCCRALLGSVNFSFILEEKS